MPEKKSVYSCSKCGNIVESLWNGANDIKCCDAIMDKLVENSVDAAVEKHVPVIVREGSKVIVKVGDIAHPMESDHYILFVELICGSQVLRHDFVEGDSVAEAKFCVADTTADLQARAFCNLHGFWISK